MSAADEIFQSLENTVRMTLDANDVAEDIRELKTKYKPGLVDAALNALARRLDKERITLEAARAMDLAEQASANRKDG